MNLKGKIYFMAILAVMLSVLGGNVTLANPIVTESTSNSTVKTETDTTTTVKSAPPSAISPSISWK